MPITVAVSVDGEPGWDFVIDNESNGSRPNTPKCSSEAPAPFDAAWVTGDAESVLKATGGAYDLAAVYAPNGLPPP